MDQPPDLRLADHVVASLKRRGVKRMFGVPGGGSSLDIIDAGARAGIDFVLTQTETAAALMAAVTAELSGTPGVVLTGIGPGAASAVNGLAYAFLERAPVVLLTDCNGSATSIHQVFDQQAVFAPLVKGGCRLTADTAERFAQLIDYALEAPYGPVHVDISASDAGRRVSVTNKAAGRRGHPVTGDITAAQRLLRASGKPIVIAGLEARSEAAAIALSRLLGGLAAPVLCTYKAKGVIASDDARFIGMFTGAAAEAPSIGEADLIIFFGLDPVEIIPAPWRYAAPVLALTTAPGHRHPVEPAVSLAGPLDAAVAAIESSLQKGTWTTGEIAKLRRDMRQTLALPGEKHTAETISRALQRAAPRGTRLTMDAGAHMFAAMACWPAARPFDVLKSNGLSTMGFALPAAIASVLEQPGVPVAAFSGDGGMMMCLGELATAARAGGKIVCVVVNDARLSLIDIKQQRQQRPAIGVRYPRVDFAAVAEGLGCHGLRAGRNDDLDAVLAEAFALEGPVVVDVEADPSGYGQQLEALRG